MYEKYKKNFLHKSVIVASITSSDECTGVGIDGKYFIGLLTAQLP